VLLPDPPLEFWDRKVLKAIGDKVGDFVFFELKYLTWEVKRMAWILVDCDLSEGVPEAIEIHTEHGVHIQLLDYWRESFRCHGCWEVGHFKDRCPRIRLNLGESSLETAKDSDPRVNLD